MLFLFRQMCGQSSIPSSHYLAHTPHRLLMCTSLKENRSANHKLY